MAVYDFAETVHSADCNTRSAPLGPSVRCMCSHCSCACVAHAALCSLLCFLMIDMHTMSGKDDNNADGSGTRSLIYRHCKPRLPFAMCVVRCRRNCGRPPDQEDRQGQHHRAAPLWPHHCRVRLFQHSIPSFRQNNNQAPLCSDGQLL